MKTNQTDNDTRTNAQSPGLESRISRREAREAILLQLRKWREDGAENIYFGALTIHPDLPDETTLGELIDVVFDSPQQQGIRQ